MSHSSHDAKASVFSGLVIIKNVFLLIHLTIIILDLFRCNMDNGKLNPFLFFPIILIPPPNSHICLFYYVMFCAFASVKIGNSLSQMGDIAFRIEWIYCHIKWNAIFYRYFFCKNFENIIYRKT